MAELKFKGNARCVWVEQNNGIIKAIYEPEPHAGMEFIMVNMRTSRGAPDLGKVYLIEIQPAFPHDAERSG